MHSTYKGALARLALSVAFIAALLPGTAFAATGSLANDELIRSQGNVIVSLSDNSHEDTSKASAERTRKLSKVFDDIHQAVSTKAEAMQYTIPYDRSHIDQVGWQAESGHTICCPSYACAYGDAVLDGTVRNHSYYTCNSCTWPDWGGGNSSFRNVGTNSELLREAYDQIRVGRPTVIHVGASFGEHWITLIGYEGVTDPDDLTLSNFRALDPWDGLEINAGAKYSLYGDGCEHISSR